MIKEILFFLLIESKSHIKRKSNDIFHSYPSCVVFIIIVSYLRVK